MNTKFHIGRITMTLLLIAAVCVLLFIATGRALALPNGVAGYSGADGQSCNDCHYGGVAPEIVLIGAHTVAPGATVQYLLEMTSTLPLSQTHAGWNVSVRERADSTEFAGTLALVPADTKSQMIGNELAHANPLANSNGVAQAAFLWTAPMESGSYTIYFSGGSVNNNAADSGVDGRSGDAAALGTFQVRVTTPTAVGLQDVGISAEIPTLLWLSLIPLILWTYRKLT